MWLRPQTANEKLKLDAQTQDGIEKKKTENTFTPNRRSDTCSLFSDSTSH